MPVVTAIAAGLGLTSAQERLYRQVLAASGTPLPQLAQGLLRTGDQLLQELGPLVDSGVVTVDAEGRLMVAEPAEAMGLALSQHARAMLECSQQLQAMSRLLPELRTAGPVASAEESLPIDGEVLAGGDVLQLLARWVGETTGELLFLRPDQWRMPSESQMAIAVAAAIQEGRPARAIYPARALREAPAVLVGRAAIGERIRVVPEVPTRLAVIGDRVLAPRPPGARQRAPARGAPPGAGRAGRPLLRGALGPRGRRPRPRARRGLPGPQRAAAATAGPGRQGRADRPHPRRQPAHRPPPDRRDHGRARCRLPVPGGGRGGRRGWL